MSINNREDWLAQWSENGLFVTDHLYFGNNRLAPPGSYTADWDTGEVDSVTFKGTEGRDTLLGGGGEFAAIFIGTRGNDLYGGGLALGDEEAFYYGVVDYSGARSSVVVNMDLRGSRTFTDETGEVRTVSIVGRALKDGFGGHDDFMEGTAFGGGYSSVTTVIGSRFADTMVGQTFDGLHGGRGDDHLAGNALYGGRGRDILIGNAPEGSSVVLFGEEGDDWIFGTDGPGRTDVYLVGGAGDDRIFAGAGDDTFLMGDEGDDWIDAGAGDDFVDGGVGKDVILSGAGNDVINPDVEYFQSDPTQPRDGARDVILVTRADLGAYRDRILFNAFEEGRDQIRFGDAVRGGKDFRVYQEDDTAHPGRVNTILQIDRNGDGFGEGAADVSDYFLVAQGADLSLHHGYLLT